MTTFLTKTVATATLIIGMAFSGAAIAASELHVEEQDWSFSGPFGKFDQAQLQRGFQIYTENCAACHSLSLVSFRNLMEPGGPGFSEAEVRAIAAEVSILDGPDGDGEMYDRPGRLADRFPSPWANEEQARASNNGAYPPDFSLLAKARAATRGFPTFVFDIFTQYQESGPDYIYGLLTGYSEDVPDDVQMLDGLHYNTHFMSGVQIAMAAPLSDDQHEYSDGSPQTVDQYARDVSAFMMWAAEPHLMDRKAMGFRVLIFLLIFAGLLYLTKRKVFASVKH
ncbi:MAG: cytochrome c1 [Alphaproteobacteria bacterium]